MARRRRYRIGTWAVAAALATASGCNSPIDPAASSSVSLDMVALDAPVVGSTLDPGATECRADVASWSADLFAHFDSPQLITPFDNVILTSVTVSHDWNSAGPTPDRTELVATTIPMFETETVSFDPIDPNDLDAGHFGDRATIAIVFRGTTIAGEPVALRVTDTLTVDACPN